MIPYTPADDEFPQRSPIRDVAHTAYQMDPRTFTPGLYVQQRYETGQNTDYKA